MVHLAAVTKTASLLAATLIVSIQYGDTAVLFPEEVPTILGIIYSLLPPVKVGQDSRVGFGFKVGPNVDTQVLFELGPQSNTQPLGATSSKRQSPDKDIDRNLIDKNELMKSLLESMQKRMKEDLQGNGVTKRVQEKNIDRNFIVINQMMKKLFDSVQNRMNKDISENSVTKNETVIDKE